MKPFLLLLTAAAGFGLLNATPVALGGAAAEQRVEITYKGVGTVGSRGTFRLQVGNVSDAGTAADSITGESFWPARGTEVHRRHVRAHAQWPPRHARDTLEWQVRLGGHAMGSRHRSVVDRKGHG
jgi:hypothetical protein